MSAPASIELEEAWLRHVGTDTDLLGRLVARHRERHRRYHGAVHVTAVVAHVVDLADAEPVDDRGAIVAAAFYHDAIHEPKHPANERASARLARRDLTALGWSPVRVDHVAAMIEATRTHVDPVDADTAVLFDADLAILGAAPDVYADYVAGVRAEYDHVDDAVWRVGRGEVVRGLLDRAAIYATSTGRSRWEQVARANLTAESTALQG